MLAELFLQSALAFLAREVPRWPQENHCFSCHNNGDAARALYAARQRGYEVPASALADTTAWLLTPTKWDEIRGAPAASDKKLGWIQFSAALAEAVRTGAVRDSAPLFEAAKSLLKLQANDGSWRMDTGGLPGAPATYGTALATYLSRGTLLTAEDAAAVTARGPSARIGITGSTRSPSEAIALAGEIAPAIARATRWLAAAEPTSTLDAAALLLADPTRAACRKFLLEAQTSDGAWGPQPKMPAEPFDTAVVLLALKGQGPAAARGRAWLLKIQDSDGGWPETTRPPGALSYAERISTTAWVVYSLLLR